MRVYVEKAFIGFDVPDDWSPKQIATALSGVSLDMDSRSVTDHIVLTLVETNMVLDHNDIMTSEHKTPCMTCGEWVDIGIDGIRAHMWGAYCATCDIC